MPDPADRPARLQLFGEIARGGMGAVLRGRDPDLGRELAVKVLLDGHRNNPELIGRFVEEAQIGGQLQHPGVVPIYELGTFGDRRPYFSMKLVKGRTLADLLAGGPAPDREPARILAVFEQVAQTVAYAHSRGVIHRDLKPSNVMVGAFGEVQVMDWGLAKVLPRGGVEDDRGAGKTTPLPETVIATARSGSGASDRSLAGSVMGTPSYMAPEQARGEIERIDERADVFALGSILCEILTGGPAFRGPSSAQIQRLAVRGETADALTRLDACGADPELVALARDCLAVEPEGRPSDAGAVAGRVGAHLAGVQDRLRTAERERAVAVARAVEERKRRKLAVTMGTAVAALIALLGAGGSWLVYQQQARAARVDLAVREAEFLERRAEAVDDDLALWVEAREAARRAAQLADDARDAATRSRAVALAGEVSRRSEQAAREHLLIDNVDEIRATRGEHWDPARTDAEFGAAFRAAEIDPDRESPESVSSRVAGRRMAIDLVAALEEWAIVRVNLPAGSGLEGAARLRRLANAVDPDPWRGELRQALARDDHDLLHRLADDDKLAGQPAFVALLLASHFRREGQSPRAMAVLQAAWRRHPGDFWVNLDLSDLATKLRPSRPDEALRFGSIALALRPRSGAAHLNYGNALRLLGRADDALLACREAVRLSPASQPAHTGLAAVLLARGLYEEAASESRVAVGLNPQDAMARVNLGLALTDLGRHAEAIDCCREATRLAPKMVRAHASLGLALRDGGQPKEAVAAFRRARQLAPDEPSLVSTIERDLKAAEHEASLAERLPAVLRREDRPKEAADRIILARLCYDRGFPAAAARLYGEAMDADSTVLDHGAPHRYNAACAAALAAAGRGDDHPTLDDQARVRLRKQALGWLKAERDARALYMRSAPPAARERVAATMRRWREQPDLVGVRDSEALAKLPGDEQKAWRSLWQEIDELLSEKRGGRP
jgi:serine/threonine-protein kinase